MNTLDDADRALINNIVTSGLIDGVKRLQVTSFLSNYEYTGWVTAQNMPDVIKEIAWYATIVKPFYFCGNIRLGVAEGTHLSKLSTITETSFIDYIESLKPTGNRILDDIIVRYHDDENIKVYEEVVFGYFKEFLRSMSMEETKLFLKFVTGYEILKENVFVEFSGSDHLCMLLPTAHTCSNIIRLSRYFTSQKHFNEMMRKVLYNTDDWQFSIL